MTNLDVKIKHNKKTGKTGLWLRNRYIGWIKKDGFWKPNNVLFKIHDAYFIEVAILNYLEQIATQFINMKIGNTWKRVKRIDFQFSELETTYAGFRQKGLKTYQIDALNNARFYLDTKKADNPHPTSKELLKDIMTGQLSGGLERWIE